jgi:hypothetical protein
MDDMKGRARETYETASDRLSHAADTLRGKEDFHIFGKVSALLIGVGVGVGLLIAPASGGETRADIATRFRISARGSVSAPLGERRRV